MTDETTTGDGRSADDDGSAGDDAPSGDDGSTAVGDATADDGDGASGAGDGEDASTGTRGPGASRDPDPDRHGVGEPPGRPDRAADALAGDPALAEVVAEHGPLSLSPSEDPFRRLVVAIVRQQVSSAAARSIERRLFGAVEPTPAAVLAADPETLRGAGLSGRKVEYVRNVARAVRDGEVPADRAAFAGVPDDEVVDRLTAITGVGEWTAAMFLISQTMIPFRYQKPYV